MRHPFRRYAINLSLRLKMPVNQLLNEMDSADIAEYMAYDITSDEDWLKRYKQKQELDRSRDMSPEEKAEAFMAAMGRAI